VRRLAHENLLPALERFTVIVSRLRGLSKFQVSNVMLGLSTQDLDSVLDTVYCLQLVGHRILIASGLELRQFQAFSAWLRQEIDNQSTDAGNADSPEKDTNVDHASTLEYIQGAMTQSELTRFFDLEGDGAHSLRWDLKAEERSLFELYKRELKVESKEGATTKRLPALDALLNHLDDQCSAIFSSITETQKRNVRFGSPTFLGVGTPACMDMRMLIEVRPLFMHIEFDSLIITRPSIPRRLASLLRTSSWDLVPNSVKVRLSNYRLGKY
jgi:anaphase-promoting complex subunit 4